MSGSLLRDRFFCEFIVFGGGQANHRRAATRLGMQGQMSSIFSHVTVATDRKLRIETPSFWSRHKSVLQRGVPGFGWWIWKPFIIGQALRRAEKGLVLYLDSGSVLNINTQSLARLEAYFEQAMDSGGLAFQLKDRFEAQYTKAATARALNASEVDMASEQICATALLVKRDRKSVDLVDEWLSIAVSDNYSYVNNTLEESDLTSSLIAPRNDQSIWSLLVKQSSLAVIGDETYFAPDWHSGRNFPLWAIRHRSGTPPFSSDLRSKVVRRFERMMP